MPVRNVFHSLLRPAAPLAALVMLAVPAACTLVPAQTAFAQEPTMSTFHPNSIQPETTLAITTTGEVMREPDIAFISTGVQTEAETASEAMAQNRLAMNGVFSALREAGIQDRHIQTSNFSLGPRYDYVETPNGRNQRVLAGYVVSNQVTAKVTDLTAVGATLDALVEAGGNTFNGISFALEDDSEARNEARRLAMEEAIARAELYAEAAGYEVARIVTINEYERQSSPEPMMVRRDMAMAESAPTPISGGEVGYSVQVNVTFELSK